jgi:hypothetical protein
MPGDSRGEMLDRRPPMTTFKASDPVGDQVLEFVRKSEETITEATRRWTETLRELAPGDGESIRRVVDGAFDFTERVMKNQREFANSMLDTLLGEPARKRAPAAKRATTSKRASGASSHRRARSAAGTA